MRQIFVWVLCLIMAVSLIGCGQKSTDAAGGQDAGKDTADSGTSSEPIEVSWMMTALGTIDLENPNLKVYQAMNEAADIKIKPIVVPEDSYEDKFAAVIASNDMYDIMAGAPVSQTIQSIGPQGLFVAISDNYDKMPKLKGLLDKYPLDTKAILSTDGKLYQFPTVFVDVTYASTGLVMREDLLNAAGIKPDSIETMDDLYSAFAAMSAQNSGKPVISARFNIKNMAYIARMFGGDFLVAYNNETKKFEYPVYKNETKMAVEFLNKMYTDGLLHPEWASMSDAVWEEAVSTGELATYVDNMQMLAARNSDLASSVGEHAKLIPVLPPKINGKIRPWSSNPSVMLGGWGGPVISSAVTGEKLSRIFTLMNWIYDYEKSSPSLLWGEEGVTFVYDEQGYPRYIVDVDWENGNGPLPKEYGVNVFALVVTPERFYDIATNPVGENPFMDAMELYKEVYAYSTPSVAFTTEETDRLKVIKTPLDTFVQENIIKFINGTTPMSQWDQFVAKLTEMKIHEVEEIYNTALSRLN